MILRIHYQPDPGLAPLFVCNWKRVHLLAACILDVNRTSPLTWLQKALR